jgi:hypothetical protein
MFGSWFLKLWIMSSGLIVPEFYIDNLPAVKDTENRELLRHIKIVADRDSIFQWLKQLRVAPYSYDILDNRGIKSPDYIIENLPDLKLNAHFLLAFHIYGFEENTFIAGRFCQPVNPPVNLYLKDLFIEYRIVGQNNVNVLWCKVKGFYNKGLAAKGFFTVFSVVNKIMMTRQLQKIRRLSGLLKAGKIKHGRFKFTKYYRESGIHWWFFCRRHNCKGLMNK